MAENLADALGEELDKLAIKSPSELLRMREERFLSIAS